MSPLSYIEIPTIETLIELYKTRDLPQKLLHTCLETINSRYPEEDWIRIYTDGLLMDPKEGAGAAIFSNLFSQYLALGHGSTAFEAELCAIGNAMEQMIYRPNINKKKIVVLVDSKAVYISSDK
jgi:hypothetical protein